MKERREGEVKEESIEREGMREGEVRVVGAHGYESSLQQAEQSPACIFL